MRTIESGAKMERPELLGQALWNIDGFNRQLEDIRRGITVANEPQVLDKDFDIEKLMKWIQEKK